MAEEATARKPQLPRFWVFLPGLPDFLVGRVAFLEGLVVSVASLEDSRWRIDRQLRRGFFGEVEDCTVPAEVDGVDELERDDGLEVLPSKGCPDGIVRHPLSLRPSPRGGLAGRCV